MASEELIGIAHDHQAAKAAAHEAAALTQFNADILTLHRFKQQWSWVYFNEGDDGPEMVVKVEPDIDGQLLPQKIASVALIQELHENGAPVETHLIKPQSIGRYVVTATTYLPGTFEGKTNLRAFGEGLARLHSIPIESMLDRLPVFDPLSVTKSTLDKLQVLRDNDALPKYKAEGKEVVFDERLVEQFERLIESGEAAAHELADLTEQKGYKPALLHNDIHPYNALIDKNGQTIFIDLDCYMTGPWAYDFGRPLGQWWCFRRKSEMVRTLVKGYETAVPWPLDDQLLKLGVQVAKARYVPTLMTRVVDMALRGEPQNEYLLGESIRRISGSRYWQSEELYIRGQSAKNGPN